MEFHDFLVLRASDVSRVGISAGAGDIAELAAQRVLPGPARGRHHLRGSGARRLGSDVLLLVLLTVQMLLIFNVWGLYKWEGIGKRSEGLVGRVKGEEKEKGVRYRQCENAHERKKVRE